MAHEGSVIHHVFLFFERFEHLVQLLVGDPTALTPQDFAAPEEDQRRNGVDAVAENGLGVFGRVDVDLEDIRPSVHLHSEFFDHGLHLPAGAAP